MLRNYLKIALRTLRKQKGYAFINIFGLSVGLACFLLIAMFVQHEFSYDRFHENADQIYRVVKHYPGDASQGIDAWAVTSAPLAGALVDEFPEITEATAIDERGRALLSLSDRHVAGEGLAADAHFFDIFSFPLQRGNPETALAGPNRIVLTAPLARRLFGDEDPVGHTLRYQNEAAYTVTGVTPAVPATSSLRFDFITSIQSQPDYLGDVAANRWGSNNYHTFFRAQDGVDAAQLQAKMPTLVEKYVADGEDDPARRVQYLVQPLRDMHLRSQFNFDVAFTGNLAYVYLFAVIGGVILLLACINYTNLAVARSMNRTGEVGLRKAIGARRGQLVGQFLGESVLVACMALVLALGLVQLLLPTFSQLMERPLGGVDIPGVGLLVPGLAVLVLLVGLLSGSYPAFFMSSLRPAQVLKGTMGGGPRRFRVQRLLVVGQFVISIALIAGSFVVHEQMQFMQSKDLGYDREHVVTVPVRDNALRRQYAEIRGEWLRDPHVLAVTSSLHLPTHVTRSNGITLPASESETADRLDVYMTYADYDYLGVFGIELIAGRTFSRAFPRDTLHAALINEQMVQAAGWTPEDAIGKTFVHNGEERTVIGVVADFHFDSMRVPIEPLVIRFNADRVEQMRYISARIRPNDVSETMAFLERSVKPFASTPLAYQFLDARFDMLYKEERRMGEMFSFFTAVALLIASLGLFGVAAYAAERRTKEIGVRKALGASVISIVTLLSTDVLKLVGIAFLLATPVAYVAMSRWLADFAYRIDLGTNVFLGAGALALIVALLTVSYQAIHAACIDPVDALHTE